MSAVDDVFSLATKVAKTSLLIPFRDRSGLSCQAWSARMRDRGLAPPPGRDRGDMIWVERGRGDLPRELDELFEPIQSVIRDAAWLELNPNIQQRLRDVRVQQGAAAYTVSFVGTHAVQLLPGVGCLVLELDLGELATVGETADALFALRHMRSDRKADGLYFVRAGAPLAGKGAPDSDLARDLGPALAPAVAAAAGEGEPLVPVSLGALANWLLLLPGERPERIDPAAHRAERDSGAALPAEARAGITRYGLHHSVVVLDGAPSGAGAERLSFVLRRAYNTRYVAPRDLGGQADVVERPRDNRIIGISREGAASVSWLAPGAEHEFELHQWPSKFAGIYRLLNAYALLERQNILREIERLHGFAGRLRGVRRNAPEYASLFEDMDLAVRECVGRLLEVSGGDGGGITDYHRFLEDARRCHAVDASRRELRRQLRELDHVIESGYNRTLQELEKAEHERETREARRFKKLSLLGTVVGGVMFLVAIPDLVATVFPGHMKRWGAWWLIGAAVAGLVLLFPLRAWLARDE